MKKIIFGFILGGIIFGSIVYASSYYAKDVMYEPTDASWNVSNVNEALNDLYEINNQIKRDNVQFFDVEISTAYPTLTFTDIDEPTFFIMHLYKGYTSYGRNCNFISITPNGTFYMVSDMTIIITSEYDKDNRTFTVSWTHGGGAAVKNRYTGTWEVAIGTTD